MNHCILGTNKILNINYATIEKKVMIKTPLNSDGTLCDIHRSVKDKAQDSIEIG